MGFLFPVLPDVSSLYALGMVVIGIGILGAGIGPITRISTDDWARQRDVVRVFFSFPSEDEFERRFAKIRLYDLLTPEEASVDVRSEMVAKDLRDVPRLRDRIVRHMWPDGLPLERRADAVDEMAPPFKSVKQAYTFEIKMDRKLSATTIFLQSRRDGDCLMVFHDGHYVRSENFAKSAGWRLVEPLLEAGCDMLFVPMPLYKSRERMMALNSIGGSIFMNGHNAFVAIDDGDKWALRFFLEPTIVSLNEALARKEYKKVGMAGLSGGGWTTVLVAALDTRIKHSYPSLGVLSPPAQPVSDNFTLDFEYRYPALFEIVDHYSLMMMGIAEPSRSAIHSYTHGDITFPRNKTAAFATQVSAIAEEWNTGSIQFFVDQDSDKHAITPGIARVILSHYLSK